MALPYAYVVEYRVVDACFPPDCRIDGKRTFGRASGGPDVAGDGAYVAVGTDKNELFAKRGVVIPPRGSIAFTLPALEKEHPSQSVTGSAPQSVFDASFAAVGEGHGAFRAVLEVSGAFPTVRRTFEGVTAPFVAETSVERLGHEERYFLRVREALPARRAPMTVTLRNEGATSLGVGAPLVLRRVEGRGPRQAFLVLFDAVPYPLFEQLYRTEETSAGRFVSSWVRHGTLFPRAISPGQLTGSFVRRFFRGDYYRLEGDPSLADQGFDETPTERAAGPIARLAERGFVTSALASNLYLSPVLSRIGFDSDYNIESTIELQIHPEVLAARFAREIDVHGDDDAVFVIWYANTHFPWREGRAAPPLSPRGLPVGELDRGVLEPIWSNLFDSVASLRRIVENAWARRPDAERTWIMTADHGHSFTLAARAKPWRLANEAVDNGHMHCCLATEQESRTPLAIVLEGGEAMGAQARSRKAVIETTISTLSAWSVVEQRLGAGLDLPTTSAFDSPFEAANARGETASARGAFDDGIVVAVGNSGALFGRHGDFSYHAYQPAMHLGPAWTSDSVARLLRGSVAPAGDIPAEELYAPATDPGETDNLAASHFEDLLDMRRRMSSWLAEYGDGPLHERFVYRLTFDRKRSMTIAAPRGFVLTDERGKSVSGARVTASGESLRIEDDKEPLGVVDLWGEAISPRLVVRCGASGLPLAHLDGEHPRLNLALLRTNCVGPPSGAPPAAGEAVFEATLASKRESGRSEGPRAIPELRRALERWGYVREK